MSYHDDIFRRKVTIKDKQIEDLTCRLEVIENNQVTYISIKEAGKCPKCNSTRIFTGDDTHLNINAENGDFEFLDKTNLRTNSNSALHVNHSSIQRSMG
jgi:hypothetical protein